MITWGIDVGSSDTKFIKLSVNDEQVEILEYGVYEEKDAGPTLSFPPSALSRGWSKHKIGKHDQVAISVPGHRAIARFTRLPPVAANRLPDIVRYEAEQQMPYNIDEIAWFFHHFPTAPTEFEVGIFGIKKEVLEQSLSQFEEVGFEAVHIAQASTIALYNALYYAGVFEENTVVVDIGHEFTQIIIVAPTMWTRVVPLGGERLLEKLVKDFKLSESKAKSLLKSVEESKYARQIFQSMQPVYADLVSEIQRSIDFFSSTHHDTKINKMVVTGGCSKIPGLIKYLEQNLGISNLDVAGNIDLTGPKADFRLTDRQLWTAYGLALQAGGLAEIEEQFIPPSLSPIAAIKKAFKKIHFPALVTLIVIAAIFIAILVGAITNPGREVLTEELVNATGGVGVNANKIDLLESYALIRIEMLPDGGVKVTPQYSPAYDEFNAAANPLSHQMIKQMMKEQILGKGTSP